MTKTIINLALPVVVQEVENVLDTYPNHPYQQAFSAPDLRQKLISYVLCRIPSCYAVVENSQQPVIDRKSLCFSLEQDLQVEALIRRGIQQIVQEDSEWVERHIPKEVEPEFTPSNWFG